MLTKSETLVKKSLLGYFRISRHYNMKFIGKFKEKDACQNNELMIHEFEEILPMVDKIRTMVEQLTDAKIPVSVKIDIHKKKIILEKL